MNPENRNRLGAEKSPYLLQHKDNPVHWYPWGDAAFAAAKAENKPVFLSVGYSTCYWCHMMEKDSFESPDVARVMNEKFINVKVDREEHPDVDRIYMDAVMAMTGRGGWPMSVFLTPEREPFFGGTFFWRPQFVHVLERVHEEWVSRRDEIAGFGARVREAIAEDAPASGGACDESLPDSALEFLRRRFDPAHGGFGPAPKFPHAGDAALLLRLAARRGDERAAEMALKTLDAMARGGLYDHLGGGFHRYSTDEKWFAPHFEKMLYDNAQLARVYAEAFQFTGREAYASVVRDTLDYVLREMTDAGGGFYAAQDAGDAGKEGEFYVWTHAELARILSPGELAAAERIFGAAPRGNWEHGQNIIHIAAAALEDGFSPEARAVTRKLFAFRDKNRAKPRRDDKILAAWNGLMISGFCKGYQITREKRYLAAAENAAAFLRGRLVKDGRLLRRYCDGEARFHGTLDDHAFLICGLLDLFAAGFAPEWLAWALELQAAADRLFRDAADGGYFFSASDETGLIARKKDWHDSSLPSGNAVTLANLQRLLALTGEVAYRDAAATLLKTFAGRMAEGRVAGFSHALAAVDRALAGSVEVAVVAEKGDPAAEAFLARLGRAFLPHHTVVRGAPGDFENLAPFRGKTARDGRATAYVCRGQTCSAPLTDWDKAWEAACRPASHLSRLSKNP